MIYIRLEDTSNNEVEVVATNHMPFDSIHGIGKTEEQLTVNELLIDDIPKELRQEGKQSKLMYNKANRELYYDHIDIVPTLDQQIALELQKQTAAIIFTLVENGLM